MKLNNSGQNAPKSKGITKVKSGETDAIIGLRSLANIDQENKDIKPNRDTRDSDQWINLRPDLTPMTNNGGLQDQILSPIEGRKRFRKSSSDSEFDSIDDADWNRIKLKFQKDIVEVTNSSSNLDDKMQKEEHKIYAKNAGEVMSSTRPTELKERMSQQIIQEDVELTSASDNGTASIVISASEGNSEDWRSASESSQEKNGDKNATTKRDADEISNDDQLPKRNTSGNLYSDEQFLKVETRSSSESLSNHNRVSENKITVSSKESANKYDQSIREEFHSKTKREIEIQPFEERKSSNLRSYLSANDTFEESDTIQIRRLNVPGIIKDMEEIEVDESSQNYTTKEKRAVVVFPSTKGN